MIKTVVERIGALSHGASVGVLWADAIVRRSNNVGRLAVLSRVSWTYSQGAMPCRKECSGRGQVVDPS